MAWPYQFVSLDAEERTIRQQTLGRYANYSQISALLPVVLFLLYRISQWASRFAKGRRGRYDAIPNSPALKVQRQSALGAWNAHLDKLKWWLGGDVYILGQQSGHRDQWAFGIVWTAWLLLLCVLETDNGKYQPLSFGLHMVAIEAPGRLSTLAADKAAKLVTLLEQG
jgi:hypothetical protein